MKLIIDMHTHTIASGHAFSTIEEMAAAAAAKGLRMIATTDHGPAMEGAPIAMFFSALLMLPKEISGVRVLRGVEANIVDYDGSLDLPQDVLKRLDFVLAGFHEVVLRPSKDRAQNTRAMINVLENPYVDAISHPGNSNYPVDIPAVARAARERGKLLEINNNSAVVRPGSEDNCRRIAEACRELKIPVICGSDAHTSFNVGAFSNTQKILKSVNFPKELVLNTSVRKMTKFLNGIRKRGLK
ncbi:MAG: phosphatase [Synergistaceae bacterium]|jgi:putative hydrolase|nr:phosphatase [Synergistaceae bacterium]